MRGLAPGEPIVAELVGGPEVWADGAVVRFGREVITVICYREEEDGQRVEVMRVRMPPSGFARSLIATWHKWTERAH